MRSWIERLEREARGEFTEIPQKDGTVARFSQSGLREAYANLMARLGAGDEAPPEHPLLIAARSSSDGWWSQSVYAADPNEWTESVPDISE